MKIRRYLAKDTQEAILKVKMDLGSEAVILNTRKVRQKGSFSFFKKPLVEVLAAVDEYYATRDKKDSSKNFGRNEEERSPAEKYSPGFESKGEFKKDLRENNDLVEKKEEKIILLENKVNNMEAVLQKIYEQVRLSGEKQAEKPETVNENDDQKPLPKVLELFYNNLLKNEVDENYVNQLMSVVQPKVHENVGVNEAGSMLYSIMAGTLGQPQIIKLREDGKPTVVIFVGPTGVGKTTTLAKIAANYSLNQKKKVGLITADTYRIAAVEQLRTYAEILGMPIEVIYSVNEINDAIGKYQDRDIILIDTAGRSYRNKTQFDELKILVQASGADEVFLVLSTTTGMSNCRDIISSYSFLKNYKLIFTKLDETPSVGIIFNARNWTNMDLSYITTGQSVPDDIEVANIDKITKNLLGSIS